MTETEAPREIVLEARNDGQTLELLQRVFQSSRIKTETVSSNPIRIKIPATTKAVSVLLLLLDELKPEGNIIMDNGSSYSIDEEGLSKLRRIAIKSLSTEQEIPRPRPEAVATTTTTTTKPLPSVDSQTDLRRPLPKPAPQVFRSTDVSLLTMIFALLIGVVATFVTLLSILGKIDGLYTVVILGACVIGAFSVMHRYAGAFKENRS
jgi:hypothetical protein